MELMMAKGAALVGTNLVGELVKETVKQYISPRLKILYDKSSMDRERNLIEYNIEEYLERAYKNNECINTIVFKNQQKKLEELYIPLTVIKHVENRENEKIEICIDKYNEIFIPVYNKVLLVDNAGMGKSTIMKYLYLSVIKQNVGIPILIELRKLDKDSSIVDFIIREINGISGKCNREIILELIKGGDFIFFFDGYDEITLENKIKVTENIQDFMNKAYNNKFVISSREEAELNSFGDFQRFDIKSLSKDEAYELIKKYDNNGELSKELINKLENEGNLRILKEFLENPLMVSLLYKAFEYNKSIPYKKHIFYKQVYDALFEQHDLSKGGAYKHMKKSALDIDDFHKILRCIGLITLAKGISYSREDLIKIIDTAKKKNSEIEFKTNDFLWDIVQSVPIFTKEGIEYKWAHKSFQEYFAASYVCNDAKEQQDKLLIAMANENKIYKYYNILDFCYDMDYKNFIRAIIYPIIKEFELYYRNSYKSEYFNNYDKEEVKLRKLLEFSHGEIFIKKLNNKDINSDDQFKEIFSGIELKGTISLIEDTKLAMQLGDRKKSMILRLMNNKGSNLIMELNHSLTFIAEEMFRLIENYEWNQVNDDSKNELNKYKIFPLVNKFILNECVGAINMKRLVFNYDECIKLKNKIENEIEEEKNDIDFL